MMHRHRSLILPALLACALALGTTRDAADAQQRPPPSPLPTAPQQPPPPGVPRVGDPIPPLPPFTGPQPSPAELEARRQEVLRWREQRSRELGIDFSQAHTWPPPPADPAPAPVPGRIHPGYPVDPSQLR